MISGFDELSLALFTTLAPAGAFGFICMAIALFSPTMDSQEKSQLDKFLALPLAMVLIGFIASATHLGTPANALYVFTGVGRSPLSNEVFSIVVFFALAGSYWILSFRKNFHGTSQNKFCGDPATVLKRVLLILACIAGAVFIIMTSVAYSVSTVPTWNTPYTVSLLVIFAPFSGALLALLGKTLARYESKLFDRAMLIVAALSFVACFIISFAHEASLAAIANNEVTASNLVPDYFGAIWIHGLLGLGGLACTACSIKFGKNGQKLALRVAAYLFVLAAVFLARLMFYELHMTVGY